MDETSEESMQRLIARTQDTARQMRDSVRFDELLSEVPPPEPYPEEVLSAIERESADLYRMVADSNFPMPPEEPISFMSSISEIDAWERREIAAIRKLFSPNDHDAAGNE